MAAAIPRGILIPVSGLADRIANRRIDPGAQFLRYFWMALAIRFARVASNFAGRFLFSLPTMLKRLSGYSDANVGLLGAVAVCNTLCGHAF